MRLRATHVVIAALLVYFALVAAFCGCATLNGFQLDEPGCAAVCADARGYIYGSVLLRGRRPEKRCLCVDEEQREGRPPAAVPERDTNGGGPTTPIRAQSRAGRGRGRFPLTGYCTMRVECTHTREAAPQPARDVKT